MIQDMIENFQKMRNFFITKIRNFDSFSFRDVSDSFVPRVMRDGVDTLERARPVCTEALIFIYTNHMHIKYIHMICENM